MTIDDRRAKLERVRKAKDGWIARCPAHDDRTPSLSVAKGQDGQILLRCFAGCSLAEILDSLSLAVADLYPDGTEGNPSPNGEKSNASVIEATAVPAVSDWLPRPPRLPGAASMCLRPLGSPL